MDDLPYLVAGGGIAGLSAALGLAGTGRPVRLFERAPAFEEVGAGLQMSPNGVRALIALGAWDAVEPACVIPSEIHLRDGVSGSLLQRIRLGKSFEQQHGAPYRVCHRADLLAGLVTAARRRTSIELAVSRGVASADISGRTPCFGFEDGGEAQGIALVAADGIRSKLRALVSGEVPAVDRGHAIFRALIPLRAVPPPIEADCVTLWLCRGGHVVHYPVSNWRNFNIVAAADGSGNESGWGLLASPSDVAARFGDVCEELAGLLGAPQAWLRWRAADLPGLPRWSKGAVVLTGDAAHATLPYLAQGAVMALEDAVVLAREAKASPPEEAFRRFERIRRPRTDRIQAQSRRMGRIYHATGAMALGRNMALRLLGPAISDRTTGWIYRWTPDSVAAG